MISVNGVSVDYKKIQAVIEWPSPKTLKALRGFLGLTGYYRKFIRGYITLAAPLKAFTKKTSHWSKETKDAFENLKHVLTSQPVLTLPDFGAPFIIECDASSIRIGAVQMQNGHPFAFISQELKNPQKHISAYEREMLEIILASKKWRQYLLGREFIILTDDETLKHLLEQKLYTEAQHSWLLKLLHYKYTVEYKKEKRTWWQTASLEEMKWIHHLCSQWWQ